MSILPERHALSRARFFLSLAEQCSPSERKEFEAFIEASIIFARTALHRFKHKHSRNPAWNSWFESLNQDPAVNFFRLQRDFILKDGPPKIGQVINFNPVQKVAELYFFETSEPPDEKGNIINIPATETIKEHLTSLTETIVQAELLFNQ
jgi:hypothetical protein